MKTGGILKSRKTGEKEQKKHKLLQKCQLCVRAATRWHSLTLSHPNRAEFHLFIVNLLPFEEVAVLPTPIMEKV